MTIPMFPSSLKCMSRNNFSHQLGDDRRMTPADEGPTRVRRQRSLSADVVQLMIDTNLAGRETFGKFFKETTKNGSIPFHMIDPVLDGVPIKLNTGEILTNEDGEPILIAAYWLCLFGDQSPTYSIEGVRWKINFSVMVMP